MYGISRAPLVLIAALAFSGIAACGNPAPVPASPTGVASASGALPTSSAPSSSLTTVPSAPTASGSSAAVATCWPLRGGTPSVATVTDVRTGTLAGADRLVIQFDTVVPTYELKPNDRGPGSTEFLGSASGLPLTVAGSFGLHLQLRGLVLPNNYPHGTDIHVTSAELKEARVVGDFEAITDIGIGLAVERCPKVTTLTGPPRLVIDFPTS